MVQLKSNVVLAAFVFTCCAVFCDAYPSHRQLLPPRPGYIPVYIQNGDTPLEEISLELAEAFHAIPSGRSANKELLADQPEDEAVIHYDPIKSEKTNVITLEDAADGKIDLVQIESEAPVEPEAKATDIEKIINKSESPDSKYIQKIPPSQVEQS